MAINIPDSVYAKFNEAVDAMISEFGVACTLVYPAKRVACSNCITDTIGRRSGNRYRTGGPIPFARGMVCPYCGGSGNEEDFDEIKGDDIISDDENKELGNAYRLDDTD